jgi:hypothetical protein
MSIALDLEHGKSGRPARLAARVAMAALTLGGFGFAVLFVTAARTFGFEYFHGDHTAVNGLARLLLGN